jgi:hypothetical protein
MAADPRPSIRPHARLMGLGFVATCAALAVAGCLGSTATPQIIYVSPTPSAGSQASAAASATATPMIPTTAPIVTSSDVTSSAPDNSWQVSFREPVVSGLSPAVATAIGNSLNTRVSAFISAFNGSQLPAVAAGGTPSTLKGNFTVALAKPTLLSLRFIVDTSIAGSAHPTTQAGSINFDLATGAVIQLPDLFTSPAAALPVLQTQAHARLTALLHGGLMWPASVTMTDFGQAWAFTTTGLELSWSQGAIASEAAGVPTISVPWSALSGVIAKPGPAAQFAP